MGIEFLLENSRKEVDKLERLLRDLKLVNKQDDKTKFLKKFIMEVVRSRHHAQFAQRHKLEKIQPAMLKPATRHIPYFKPHEIIKLQRLPEKKKFYKVSEREYPLVKAGDFTVVRSIVNGMYKIIEPPLTPFDIRIINDLRTSSITRDEEIMSKLKRLFAMFNTQLSADYFEKVKYYLFRDDKLGKIALMMKDARIRKISCPGLSQPVRVLHNNKDLPTDVIYNNLDEINNVVRQLARISNVEVNEFDPIVDAVLQDGTRIQAILGTSIVSPKFVITK